MLIGKKIICLISLAALISCAEAMDARKESTLAGANTGDDVIKTPVETKPVVVGDFNKDGKVNEFDLDVYRKIYNYYPQGCGADSDCDGDVDGSDFLSWQRKYGTRLYKAGDIDKNGEIDMSDLEKYAEDPTKVNVDLDR